MPLGFPVENIRSGIAYRAASGDVFVASYPKCGTTWLQYIVWLLIRRRVIGPAETLTQSFPHLEELGSEAVLHLERPRLIKTHLAFERTPWNAAARYLYIARNPFDCAVSFYHHTRGFPVHYDFAEGRFAEFFECFIAGEVDFGDYFDHLRSWGEQALRDNVLLVTYEDLRSATAPAIRHIAEFLGAHAVESIASAGQLDALIRESGLPAMRRNQQRWSSARPEWATPFVRKGVIGDWRTLFTPGQTRALLAKFDARIGAGPLASLWPDIIAAARDYARLA